MEEEPDEAVYLGNTICYPHLLPDSISSILIPSDSHVAFFDVILPRPPIQGDPSLQFLKGTDHGGRIKESQPRLSTELEGKAPSNQPNAL